MYTVWDVGNDKVYGSFELLEGALERLRELQYELQYEPNVELCIVNDSWEMVA